MFDLTGKTRIGDRRDRRHRRRDRAGAACAGRQVALSGTRREVLEALAGELSERAHVLPCNLANTDEVEALVPAAEAALGQLDILVNNAGMTRDNLFVRMRDEEWEQVLAINLTATFRLAARRGEIDDAQALRPHHRHHLGGRRHRQSGAGQLCGLQGRHDRHVQVAGAGVRHAQYHRELRRARLHCVRDDRRFNDKQREAILERVPASRLGTADDIAAAASILPRTKPPTSPDRRSMSTAEWQ